ncbi:uncharacterized protein LOC134816927 isoform X1 [Bolinopsis microptera]|uniref:uncharacterized protein LOC134816927 isoform X1 n=1 Tax=Bolinopsis microptera TaxID=2820187 RepID=UPI003079408D
MPTIRQFTVFPNISKSECEKLPQFATLSDAEKGNLLFSNELTTWWASQNKADKVKIKKDKEFHVALQRVKQTLIGIWSMDRENVSGTGNCGLGKNLTRVEALLDGRKTVEIEDFVSAISKLSNKDHSSELNGGDEVDGGDDHQNIMYGVKPVLHLVTRRVGHETVPLTTLISNILETDITNLADVDPATTAIVDVNTNSSSSLLASLESMSAIKGYDEVVASDWTAVTCVVDLSEVLRLSAMKAGQCQDLDTILVRMNSVFARVKSYLSVILIVGATEVMGDEQFDEFGKETLNKINRAYFLKTKTTLSNLVQAQVSQSCVKYYNTASSSSSSDCVQLPWAEIKKKLDSMFIFPEQRINKQVVILITTQIATVENHVLSIASKINTQKSATKNWIDKLGPGCRNDDLKRIKNTIDKLQEGIFEMHELHGKLTTQLCDLSRMYQEVYEDVEANID